jgi:hypothetical protein
MRGSDVVRVNIISSGAAEAFEALPQAVCRTTYTSGPHDGDGDGNGYFWKHAAR